MDESARPRNGDLNASSVPRPALINASSATFLVVANMIGAGVFTTSGFALADLGHPLLVFAAWMAGGGIAVCGAISYGLLAGKITESGGEYLYLSRLVHPAGGLIAGWVSLLAGFTGAIAFSATAFEVYAVPTNMRPWWLPPNTVAMLVIIAGGLLHGVQAKIGVWGQNLVVLLKIILLAVFAIMAVLACYTFREPIPANIHLEPLLISKFALSLVWISLAYSGFNAAVYVAEEIDDAAVTIPKSLFWGTLLVTLIYLVLNGIFVFGVPFEVVAGQPDVAAVAAEFLGGFWLATLIRFIIVLALASSVSSMLQVGPRVIAKMAGDGFLPHWLRKSKEAPSAAICLQVSLAVTVVYLTDLQQLLSYLGFTLSICAALTASTLFLPAQRETLLRKPINTLFVLFYVLATLTIAAVAAWDRPYEIIAAAMTLLSGLSIFLVIDFRRRRRN